MNKNLLNKYYQYSKERFPLKQFIPLSLVFAVSSGLGTQIYISDNLENFKSVLFAVLALLLFFLRLRIFDEFKDAEHDSQHYSARPIPRGLVKLNEFKKIILIIILVEVAISISRGLPSFVLFMVSFIYSLLMFKEFFIKEGIRKHFTVYIASHELLVFPLFFYLYSLNGLTLNQVGQLYFWVLTIFLGSQLFLLEVTRKIRPKELEIPSRDTYTAQYGIKGASLLVGFLGLMTIFFQFMAANILNKINYVSYLPLILVVILLLMALFFTRHPIKEAAKQLFNTSIILVFVENIIFIINIL